MLCTDKTSVLSTRSRIKSTLREILMTSSHYRFILSAISELIFYTGILYLIIIRSPFIEGLKLLQKLNRISEHSSPAVLKDAQLRISRRCGSADRQVLLRVASLPPHQADLQHAVPVVHPAPERRITGVGHCLLKAQLTLPKPSQCLTRKQTGTNPPPLLERVTARVNRRLQSAL